jgi:hypothetical protein
MNAMRRFFAASYLGVIADCFYCRLLEPITGIWYVIQTFGFFDLC